MSLISLAKSTRGVSLLVVSLVIVASLAPLLALSPAQATTSTQAGDTYVNETRIIRGLQIALTMLQHNIERIASRLEAANITLPDELKSKLEELLSVNATEITNATQLRIHIVEAAKLIHQLVRIAVESRAALKPTVVEMVKAKLFLRHLEKKSRFFMVEIRELVAEARRLLEGGNVTGAKMVLEKAWLLVEAEKAGKAVEKALEALVKHRGRVPQVEGLLKALGGVAWRARVHGVGPEAYAKIVAGLDSLMLAWEARTALGAVNASDLAARIIDAARNMTEKARKALENATSGNATASPVVEKARRLVEKAEELLEQAVADLESGKSIAAIVKARTALILAHIAYAILSGGEKIGVPWMPEPIKPWMPGIPGKKWKIPPILPPIWFEARVKALNATIVRLEAILANASLNATVNKTRLEALLNKAETLLLKAVEQYSEGRIPVALQLYHEAFRIVVYVARMLHAEDLLPVYILRIARLPVIVKLPWSVGNATALIGEIKEKIAGLEDRIRELVNKTSGFQKRLLEMAEKMLEKAKRLVSAAEKLLEKSKKEAERLLKRALLIVSAVEKAVEKIEQSLSSSSQSSGSSSGGSGESSGSSGGGGGHGGHSGKSGGH